MTSSNEVRDMRIDIRAPWAGGLLVALTLTASSGPAMADSLFTKEVEQRGTLIANKLKRFELGDIITVLVREEVDASTDAHTDTKKESTVLAEADALDNEFLISDDGLGINPGQLPNWDIETENDHKTKGVTVRGNKLTTTVACIVTEVYENGNVEISGSKQVTVNREDSKLYITGLIRSRDVTPSNTILSTQVANAEVRLIGQGPLWNNQRRGILTKILDWFSPF